MSPSEDFQEYVFSELFDIDPEDEGMLETAVGYGAQEAIKILKKKKIDWCYLCRHAGQSLHIFVPDRRAQPQFGWPMDRQTCFFCVTCYECTQTRRGEIEDKLLPLLREKAVTPLKQVKQVMKQREEWAKILRDAPTHGRPN